MAEGDRAGEGEAGGSASRATLSRGLAATCALWLVMLVARTRFASGIPALHALADPEVLLGALAVQIVILQLTLRAWFFAPPGAEGPPLPRPLAAAHAALARELPARGVLVAALVALGLSLLVATVGLLAPGADPLPPALRLVASVVALMLAPGALFVLAWPRALDLDLLEWLAAGLAVGLVLLTLACVIMLEAHWPVTRLAWLPLGAGWGLLALAAVRAGSGRLPVAVDLRCNVATVVLLAAALGCGAVTMRIGGLANIGLGRGGLADVGEPDREEEAQIIQMSEKFAALPAPTTLDITYVKHVPTTYYYPTYPFVIGLVARVSELETITVFARSRGAWTVFALLGFYAAASAIVRQRSLAAALLAAALVLVINGHAAHPPASHHWGRLAPLAHVGDFGLGVAILLMVFVAVRALDDGASWLFRGLVPLMIAAQMTIHAREVAHLLSYLVGLPVLLLLFRRDDRPRIVRVIVLGAACFLIAKSYQAMINFRVDHIAALTGVAADDLRLAFATDWAGGRTGHIGALLEHLAPLPALALLGAPLLVALAPRHPGALMMCGAMFFWTTITSFELLERCFALVSYHEIVMSPERYIQHFAVAAAGLIVLGLAWGMNHVLRRTTAFGAISMLVLGYLAARVVLGVATTLPLDRVVWVVATVELVLVTMFLLKRRGPEPPQPSWPVPAWAGVCLLPPLLALASLSSAPSLAADLAVARQKVDILDFDAWYEASPVSRSLPVPVREALRALPPNQVVAVEREDALLVTMFAPHHVLTSGNYLSSDMALFDAWAVLQEPPIVPATDIDWAGWERRLGGPPDAAQRARIQRVEVFRARKEGTRRLYEVVRPIFHEDEPDATTLRYLQAWDIDLVLLDPSRHGRLRRLLAGGAGALVVATPERELYRLQGAGERTR